MPVLKMVALKENFIQNEVAVHLTGSYLFLNASFKIPSNTLRSISSSLLIYRQPIPVLCFPNFFKAAPCSEILIGNKERFALRGEKPILSQSTSLPEGLLYLMLPKPIVEGPHIFGFSLVIFP